MQNYIKIQLPAESRNEAVARNVIASFILDLSPTVEELNDVKTAVSEAVTNAVVHAYDDGGIVYIYAEFDDNTLSITVTDYGKGIENVEKAKEPFFTTKADEERSGMGFTIMETFMDNLKIDSRIGEGTSVTMTKTIKNA